MTKTCRITIASLGFGLALVAHQGHSSTIYSLNGAGFSGAPFNGIDGWTQSEPNFSSQNPRAYVQPFSSGVTGFAVGGFYDTEPFTAVNGFAASRSLAGGYGARGAGLNVAFQMQDSSVLVDPSDPASGYFDVDRNQFSVGLGNLASLVLRPGSQSADPANSNAVWNPFLAVGGELRPFTGAQIQEGGNYTFSLSLTSLTSGLNYNSALTDLGGTSILASGSIPGASATDLLSSIDVGWVLDGTEVDGLGSNAIAISALSVTIPEPSSSFLLLTALLPFVIARRRR